MGHLASLAHMDVGMTTRECKPWSTPASSRDALIQATDAFQLSTPRRTANAPRAALHEVRRNHLARALSDWSAAELDQFDRLLTKFLNDTNKTPITKLLARGMYAPTDALHNRERK